MLLQIAVQLALIAFNAVFASAEIALLSLNQLKLEREAADMPDTGGKAGHGKRVRRLRARRKQAARLLKLLKTPSGYLATIQVGVTIAGFLGSAFASDSFARRLCAWLSWLPISAGALQTASVIAVTLIFSYISMVLGELFPKRLALRKPEALAYNLATFLWVTAALFSPLVRLLSGAVNLLLKLFGIDPNAPDSAVTEEEIRLMVDEGAGHGSILEQEKLMIENVFEFNDTTAAELMTHRLDAAILWLKEGDEDWRKTVTVNTYNYFPVCGNTIDDIAGVLDARAYLALEDKSRVNVMANAVREACFVPESIKANALFWAMRAKRNPFALVLDEYGGFSGIITMNALLGALAGGGADAGAAFDTVQGLNIRYRNMSIYSDFLSAPRPAALCYDSREVIPGALYFALSGLHVDGHDYIEDALRRGATHIVHEKDLQNYAPGIHYLKVNDSRFAMSPIADEYYGSPSKKLTVIGVTGTEGKSTTVYLIFQLLRFCGKKAGFISTVQFSVDGVEHWNTEHQTTPEATVVHRRLAEMVENGCQYAVIESSSHGLSRRLNRLGDVAFDVGVMTNVTHEHMEFHGTWEQYRDDKANLFRALGRVKKPFARPSFGVVNADDPSAAYFAEVAECEVFQWTVDSGSERKTNSNADNIVSTATPDTKLPTTHYPLPTTQINSLHAYADGNRYNIAPPDGASFAVKDNLPGAFNALNVTASVIVVSKLLGRAPEEIAGYAPELLPVKGRMTAVRCGQKFEVLVDYAHTPSSFNTIFPPIRERADANGVSIISVFGSAGERDTQKRPLQGEIAARFSDIVVLTDEDPRGEEPMTILEEMAAGIKNMERGKTLFLIPNRPQAIRKAFSLAQENDIVLLLGKGHENSIIYSSGTLKYDEITEAQNALEEMIGQRCPN
ncbi:MAG: UDP-N-acetylmuramoyl-L-alanyl-D-glutamate--2,6-diaminopimelate ligase [Spirochaetaceae bacterium]|jgi:UDP-N-acetylmuramoyl-L-alanyl-D-glutamate--2,6-diaminopimelate ligase|nr:UDP-N-acetylmuramoyl-L-alanyl-D-glutamate--2,6-diaminopimelate ligase [Spirochaetaceae bacterium]